MGYFWLVMEKIKIKILATTEVSQRYIFFEWYNFIT